MTTTCHVCHAPELDLVYESPDDLSVTTMNKLIAGRTSVSFCGRCSHLQTGELADLRRYYAEEYEINLTSDDDDQLYAMIDGRPVYRAEHQAKILLDKLQFADDSRVLDYGCAKSQTLKRVLDRHGGIRPFMFDVTDKYIPFWKTFPKAAEWSTHEPDPAWFGTMDAVLSFYALEHVANLDEAIDNVRKLLRPGGIFYFLVPNVYENAADFIVADHVNHFSRNSLRCMLSRNGFTNINVDSISHDAAFVVHATRGPGVHASCGDLLIPDRDEIRSNRATVDAMAHYWSGVVGRIREFESAIVDGEVAVYGAGFYGNFIATAMQNPGRITCFIDQNRHLQGTVIRDRPVLPPSAIPAGVKYVFVGLNPRRARESIARIEPWKSRHLEYFFL
jgi:SAM-dependent methyltransferase